MVEFNLEPQEKLPETPNGDEDMASILEDLQKAVGSVYNKTIRVFERSIIEFDSFREQVSKRLLVIAKEVIDLKDMFVEFEAQQKRMTQSELVFAERDRLFGELLKFDADKIIASV